MKKITKKTYFRPVMMVIDLPCEVLLTTSSEEETIDIPLDDFQVDPDEGTFDAL